MFMIGRNSRFEIYLLTIFRFSTTGLNTATTTPLCTRFFARSCHPKTLENSSTSPRPTPATTTRAKEVKPSVQGFEAVVGRSKESRLINLGPDSRLIGKEPNRKRSEVATSTSLKSLSVNRSCRKKFSALPGSLLFRFVASSAAARSTPTRSPVTRSAAPVRGRLRR